MREVSIDSLQQQVLTFRGESQEVRIFLWGGGFPTHTSDLDRPPPWGLSVSVPLLILHFFFLFLLCRFLLSLSGRIALPELDISTAVEGGGGLGCSLLLLLPSPPLLLLSPSPLRNLLPLPPFPLAPRLYQACCWCGARVWPLCGPPPGGKLMIQDTMARSCFSGVPLPSNGGGAPTPTPVPPWPSSLIPSPVFCLALGGRLLGSWRLPPITYIGSRTKGVRACSGGTPPLSFGLGGPPPPFLLDMRW